MTQPQTQAVRDFLLAAAGSGIPRDITGTVWLDDVTLRDRGSPRTPVIRRGSR